MSQRTRQKAYEVPVVRPAAIVSAGARHHTVSRSRLVDNVRMVHCSASHSAQVSFPSAVMPFQSTMPRGPMPPASVIKPFGRVEP